MQIVIEKKQIIMKNTFLKITAFILIIILSSCGEKKIFYSGDDYINSSPFKQNLLENGGRWEVSQEDVYYSDNNAQVYYGYKPAEVIGIMEFTEEEPDITIAGDLGNWTPEGGISEQILYQVSAQTSLEITIMGYKNSSTAASPSIGSSFTGHFGWSEDEMVWEGHDNSHSGDTLIKHTYYFRNLGE